MTEEDADCSASWRSTKRWRAIAGLPRYVEAKRDEIVFERFEFDALVGADACGAGDLGVRRAGRSVGMYGQIKARAHTPGRPAADPRVLLGLWLYACVEGVGSARQLERLTEEHNGFRWLRGGVPLNYHLLSDFRWEAAAWSTGCGAGGDGAVVGGAGDAGIAEARRHPDPGGGGSGELPAAGDAGAAAGRGGGADRAAEAGDRRRAGGFEPAAAGGAERAARERQERVTAALEAVRALQARQQAAAEAAKPPESDAPPADAKTTKKKKKEPRGSTTDVQARVMRMADGGWRPAYNVQLTGDLDRGVIVGVGIDTTGSDGGLMTPAAEEVERRYARRRQRWLTDGGFTALDDIVALARKGITVFCPLKPRRNPNNDPAAPRPAIDPRLPTGVAAWSTTPGRPGKLDATTRRT